MVFDAEMRVRPGFARPCERVVRGKERGLASESFPLTMVEASWMALVDSIDYKLLKEIEER